jgi:hypothetical protein
MKALVLDSSSIITLASNNLLWILGELKRRSGVRFLISPWVKKEVVDVPLATEKFKLQAIFVLQSISQGMIEILENRKVEAKAIDILNFANTIFYAQDELIKILHRGEAETIAIASSLDSKTIAIDEKTGRLLIESPSKLKNLLKRKLHVRITINDESLKEFKRLSKGLTVIRSSEIAAVAYERKIFSSIIKSCQRVYPKAREDFLEGMLWGLKLAGCAISIRELQEYLKILK